MDERLEQIMIQIVREYRAGGNNAVLEVVSDLEREDAWAIGEAFEGIMSAVKYEVEVRD